MIMSEHLKRFHLFVQNSFVEIYRKESRNNDAEDNSANWTSDQDDIVDDGDPHSENENEEEGRNNEVVGERLPRRRQSSYHDRSLTFIIDDRSGASHTACFAEKHQDSSTRRKKTICHGTGCAGTFFKKHSMIVRFVYAVIASI